MPLQGGIFFGLQGGDGGGDGGAGPARRRHVLQRKFLAAENFQSTVTRLRDFSSRYEYSWFRSADFSGIQPLCDATREEQADDAAAKTIQRANSNVGRGLGAALYRSHGEHLSSPATFDEAFERAARRIQAFYRGRRDRKSFVAVAWTRNAAVARIQATYKGYRHRKRFLELRASAEARVREAGALRIQAAYKGYRGRKSFFRLKSSVAAAAVKIQAFYRGYGDRKRLNSLVAAAVKIQAFCRGHRDRKRLNSLVAAAAKIQAFYRGYRDRKHLSSLVAAQLIGAVKIQSFYRGHRDRKAFVLHKVVQNAVAVKIQAVYRCYRDRKRFRQSRRLAVIIQAFYKGYSDRRQYLLRRSSAIKIQARVRTWICCSRWYTTKCLVLAQAVVRGFLIRRTVQRWKVAAFRIQYWWRKRLQHRGQAGQTLAEDWNTLQVDSLEDCLDTCLAGRLLGTSLGSPRLPLEACSVQRKKGTDEYKQKLQNETRLQQVARVFLLQHCISVQQQKARFAPPFPPQAQTSTYYSSSYDRKIIVNYSEQQQHSSPDLVLDVHCLEKNVGNILVETAAAAAGSKGLTNQLNTILVVFVAVVVYTRTIFHGVLLWAKQQNNPRNL